MPWLTHLRSAPISARLGLAIILAYALVAVFAPWLAPFSEADAVGAQYAPWAAPHYLGTDALGRDVMSRMIWGARNTVGIALVTTALNNPIQGTQFESWGYDNGVLGGGKLYENDTDNERDGFMGVLEFKPSDIYTTRLDVFYSKFDKIETKRGMEFGLAWGSAGQPVTRTNNAQGTATQATFRNFDPVIRNDYNAAKDDLFSLGWNNELEFGERWTLTADVSTSSATREERILETYAGLRSGLAGDNVSIRLNPNGYIDFDFGYNYADPNILRLTDAGGWGQDGYIKDFEVKDELTALRFDLERTFESGFISSLEFGANLTDRTKSRASNENFLCLNACRDGAEFPMPAGTGSDFDFAGLTGLYGYDALNAFNTIYNRHANVNNGDINNKNWEVNERVATFYVQANLDFDLGSIPVRGNIGVQAVTVDQSSDGFSVIQGNAANAVPFSAGKVRTDVLPSMNLAFSLTGDQTVRLALARQMARPRVDQLRSGIEFGVDNATGKPGASGGNPEADPWIANAFDVSYEKYFGTRAYVAAAAFYKDLKSYVYTQTQDGYDLSAFTQSYVPPSTCTTPAGPNQPCPAALSRGTFTAPFNGKGGSLKGVELSVSLPLNLVSDVFKGFGIQASASFTNSSIKIRDRESASSVGGGDISLPGLSKQVYNLTAYYEKNGFSARVSTRIRDGFVGEVSNFTGDRTLTWVKGENVIDLQLGYEFQTGFAKGLSLLFQVNNVGNEPYVEYYNGTTGNTIDRIKYGKTYLLGVSYKL